MSRAQLPWRTNLNCSWRKRVTKHEIEWQWFKIDRPKTKLKRALAHSRVSWKKLKTHFLKLNEEVTKMGGKIYSSWVSSTDIDECSSDPCYNGGICYDHVNRYECECPQPYSSRHCETGKFYYENLNAPTSSILLQKLGKNKKKKNQTIGKNNNIFFLLWTFSVAQDTKK